MIPNMSFSSTNQMLLDITPIISITISIHPYIHTYIISSRSIINEKQLDSMLFCILELFFLVSMENGGYYHFRCPEAEKGWVDFSATPSNESSFIVPWPVDPSSIEGVAEDKAATASSSHSQAEKRRRDRINAQLSALRQLIPRSEKMDKAALLGSAIEQVKELKRKANEIGKDFNIPTEMDQVTVDCEVGNEEEIINTTRQSKEMRRFIRASICCDDRPIVFGELIRVLKALRLSTVKADISSVGGRMNCSFILCNDDDDNDEEVVSPMTVKHSLNVVLSRIASSSGSNCRVRSKRQRMLLPSHFT